jgi:Protein of unknown function (DUF3592)
MGHPALESIYNVHARMRNSLTAKGLVGLLGIFAGLCTVFALIVSVADKWQEHVQESWPEVTAIVERCSVDPYVLIESARRDPVWHIGCRIGYRADSTQIETRIRSRSTASGWGGRMERMQQWVALHRPGSPIVVHYNPTDPKTAVLTATDMPDGGPRTPNNLRLLLISSVACLGLLTIARHLRDVASTPELGQ